VEAARGAVGAPFRPQGRDPAHGLDCLGLAALAVRAGGYDGEVPRGYRLRGGDPAVVGAALEAAGFARSNGEAGDLLLFASGPGQLHFAIATPSGVIHADAMQRRVVERPGPAPWPLLSAWRWP
jgi:cell wall-associated NlpC family hydrolase